MKVKFLTSIASHDWAYGPGQTAELSKEVAEAWIAAGTCEPVVEGIAEEPEAKPKPKK